MRSRFPLVCLLVLGFFGCKDQGKITAKRAQENAATMAKLAETDVAEIERGLPEGAPGQLLYSGFAGQSVGRSQIREKAPSAGKTN